ncbi:MAG: mannitol dehydrogenase family protein, partial [Rhodococcus sp. (in: high G+C Gram-positive bacteria)]
EGVDEQGQPIEIVDQLKDSLVPLARKQKADPTAFISNRAVFGDLIDNELFVAEYTKTLASLHEHGARATLEGLRK